MKTPREILLERHQAAVSKLDTIRETAVAALGDKAMASSAATDRRGSLRDDAKFGSWLFGIAHQKCIQRWRKQSREEILLDEIPESADEFEGGPDDLLIRREQEAEFMNLLNQLPLPQRSALLLHFVEDFSLEEIVGITGTPIGTVKSRLYYAKRALRKLLEEP